MYLDIYKSDKRSKRNIKIQKEDVINAFKVFIKNWKKTKFYVQIKANENKKIYLKEPLLLDKG